MNERERIATGLLALRVGVFIVMFMSTLDKFVNVTHASRVFESSMASVGWEPELWQASASPSCSSCWRSSSVSGSGSRTVAF